jgi:hypothetical protein
MPAGKMSQGMWKEFQRLQRLFLEAQIGNALPADIDPERAAEELQRATELTYNGDTAEYARRNYAHNKHRGQGGIRVEQYFNSPRVTLLFDRTNDDLIGGVTMVRNTSSPERMPRPLGRSYEWLKMRSSPNIPILGGRRYEKITGVIFDEPAVALAGLHVALANRPGADHAAIYHTPGDLADLEMGWMADVLGMEHTGQRLQPGALGHPDMAPQVGRYQGQIGGILDKISAFDGAPEAIASIERLSTLPSRWQGETY